MGLVVRIIESPYLGMRPTPRRYPWRKVLWARAGRRFSCRDLSKPTHITDEAVREAVFVMPDQSTMLAAPETARRLREEMTAQCGVPERYWSSVPPTARWPRLPFIEPLEDPLGSITTQEAPLTRAWWPVTEQERGDDA
jgi:hypothetical protein